jgi:hypothetical protein
MPLSRDFVSVLEKMLSWDCKERIGYGQLEKEVGEKKRKISRMSSECFGNTFSPPIQKVSSLVLFQEIEDSGSIDQGEGDTTHPLAETLSQPLLHTVRQKT